MARADRSRPAPMPVPDISGVDAAGPRQLRQRTRSGGIVHLAVSPARPVTWGSSTRRSPVRAGPPAVTRAGERQGAGTPVGTHLAATAARRAREVLPGPRAPRPHPCRPGCVAKVPSGPRRLARHLAALPGLVRVRPVRGRPSAVRCTAPDAAIPALRAEDAAFETRPRTAPSSAPAPHARPPPLVLTAATTARPGRCAHGTPRKDDRHAPGLTRDAGRQTECVRDVVTGPAGITFWLGPGAVLAPAHRTAAGRPSVSGTSSPASRVSLSGSARVWSSPRPPAPRPADRVSGRSSPAPRVSLSGSARVWSSPRPTAPPCRRAEGVTGEVRGCRPAGRIRVTHAATTVQAALGPVAGGVPYDALLAPGAPGGRRGARAGPRRAPAAGHGPGRHRSRRAGEAAPAAGRHGAPGPPAP